MMNKTISVSGFLGTLPAGLVAMSVLLSAGVANADQGFQKWIANFQPVAVKNGIMPGIYAQAFKGVTEPDPDVLSKAKFQPEFRTKVWDYLDSRVNPYTVRIGREMAKTHAGTLNALERYFGVDRTILLAIWSMESNYGAVLDDEERLHYVPQALATLAYADKSRAKFAKSQLIAALKILQAGDVSRKEMTGSWAGAMGHTQFIPTSYLLYAIDADGNGHRDIWNSIPDALATAANLLAKNGWTTGKTWGYEVIPPQGSGKLAGKTKTLAEWAAMGFVRPSGKGFKNGGERAFLKLPAGENGPGFLMTSNFSVIKKYNQSDSYALGVGLLADEIAGYSGLRQAWPRPEGALDMKQKFEIQTRLKELGYYEGEVDGNFGSGSTAAIQAFQQRIGLTPDGKPSETVLDALRN